MSERIFNPAQPKSLEELLRIKDEAIRGVANSYEAGDAAAFERSASAYKYAQKQINTLPYLEAIDEAMARLNSGDLAAAEHVRRHGMIDFLISAALGEL
jgi:hypothetical protein